MAPDSTGQQDVRTYARIFWRWKFLFAAFVILIPLAAYLVERGKPKLYASRTLLEFPGAVLLPGAPAPQSINVAATARLVTTTPVIDTAALLLHQPSRSLASEVSTSADTTSNFLTITAQDRDPQRAAAVANAVTTALNLNQTGQTTSQIQQVANAFRRQLAANPQPGARVDIQQQLAVLGGLAATASDGAQLIQAAAPSHTPVSPNTRRAVEVALVIGLLLGLRAVAVAENADRRVRTPDDVESVTGWPLLAAIPASAFSPESQGSRRNQEAFQMLREALTHFNADHPKRSVAVVSPLVGDGKTTVAVGLAIAVARAGKRVIVVDANLRRPQVNARLRIAEPEEGLGAVLAGEQSLANALIEHPVDSAEGGRLLVLGAGPRLANPVSLLGSQGMRDAFRQLEEQADLVVVDTVASLARSDALSLLQEVSGIVVVLRVNRSSRLATRRLKKMIAAAKMTVLGVVATGSGAVAGAYGYGYGLGYEYLHYPYADGHRAGAFGWLRPRLRRSSAPVESNGAVTVSEASAPEQRSAQAGETAPPGDPHD